MLRNLWVFFFMPLVLILFISVVCIVRGHAVKTDTAAQQEVKIIYYKVFFLSKPWRQSDISGCFINFKASGLQKNKNNSVLVCKEQIYLLRKKQIVTLWQKQNRLHGFVLLDMPEIGINHVKAYLISIKPASKLNNSYFSYENDKNIKHFDNIRPVTGIFIRHVTKVRRYLFKNIKTGRISAVNTTPEHRFYVSNQQAFISISKVSPSDKLITDNGEEVRVITGIKGREKERSHDKSNYSEILKTVYNLEVSQKHTYFVGSLHLYVHNMYTILRDDGSVAFKGDMNGGTYTGSFYRRNRTLKYKGSARDIRGAKRYGFGREYDASGALIYRGDLVDGKRNGYGESFGYGISINGESIERLKIYAGYWKDGDFHGRGVVYFKCRIKGVEYAQMMGRFKKNHLVKGKYYKLVTDKIMGKTPVLLYDGEFKDLQYHGNGIYYEYVRDGYMCKGYRTGRWSENKLWHGVGYSVADNLRTIYYKGAGYYIHNW